MKNNSKFEREEVFTNKKGNLKRLPSEFYYDKYKFNNYECIKRNGQLFMYVKTDDDKNFQNYLSVTKSQKPELLISMLSLRDNLPNKIFSSPTRIMFCDEYISDTTINKIIKWCKANGYPFCIDTKIESTEKTPKQKNLIKNLKLPLYQFLKISDFIFHLNEIYGAFYMQRKLNDFTGNLNSPIYTSIESKGNFEINNFVDIRNLSKDKCKKLFEYKYKSIKFDNQISFEDGLHFNVITHSLFDAAFYQLALMMYDSKMELRVCPLCNKYFEPQHGRQKYCHRGCYPQKAYKREADSKKKKSSQANKA